MNFGWRYCWNRFTKEIFSCNGNTSGTQHILIRVHIYLTICIITCGVPPRMPVTLKNLSFHWRLLSIYAFIILDPKRMTIPIEIKEYYVYNKVFKEKN
ncbi:unnamed protein product [Malus baccata var. baccata]